MQWIDCDGDNVEPGRTGYLVRTLNTSTGRESWAIRDRPLRTNQTREPRLWGWCGETDNKSRTAQGVCKVARVNAAGDRCAVVRVVGAELAAWLEADGHPDLAAQAEPEVTP